MVPRRPIDRAPGPALGSGPGQSTPKSGRTSKLVGIAIESPGGSEMTMLRYLGFSFIWAWLYLAYSSPVVFPLASAGTGSPTGLFAQAYTTTFATGAFMSLAAALMAQHLTVARVRQIFRFSMPALVTLGTLLLALAGRKLLGLPWLYGASTAVGISSAWVIIAWGERYAALSARQVAILTPSSMFLGVVTYIVVLALPSPIGVAVTAALPLFSAFALHSTGTDNEVRVQATAANPIRMFWRLFLGTAVYACAFGFLRAFATVSRPQLFDISNRLWLLSSGAAALLVTVTAIIVRWRIDVIRVVYSSVLPLMTAGFLLLTVFGQGNYILAGAAAMTGYTSFDMLIWMLHSQIAFRYGQSLKVFGWGRFFSFGGVLLGIQLCLLISKSTSGTELQLGTISMWAVFVLVVAAAFLLREKDLPPSETVAIIVDNGEALNGDLLRLALEHRCDQLASEKGLSPRETEILILLARGHSLPYVQKALQISRGTASTHADHIYRKLNVHTRQELLDLIDNAGIESRP